MNKLKILEEKLQKAIYEFKVWRDGHSTEYSYGDVVEHQNRHEYIKSIEKEILEWKENNIG